jgi:ubiquinone/menaquinone biosynthesis C-methylase UbiE
MKTARSTLSRISGEIQKHYDQEAEEQTRLEQHAGQLEYYRTKEIIGRHLPRKATVVLDIGGGPGRYATWLANLGHQVHLVDPVALHVEQAQEAVSSQGGKPLASATVGDARDLKFPDRSAGVVLLLGPLYHLVKRTDRVKSLLQAQRKLKPGGLLFAAAISRFASALDGLFRNFVEDPDFYRILEQDLKNGQHRNPTNKPQYFTTAFFHHPDELRSEIEDAGFAPAQLYALEGPGWLVPDFERKWNDPEMRGKFLSIIRTVETEPTLLGQSAHLLAVARKA